MTPLATTLLVGVAGALGAGGRLLAVEIVARWWRRSFPLAIFLVNLSGAFLLGLLTAAFPGQAGLEPRLLIGTGFLGGYTTFSTLSYDTAALSRRGASLAAFINLAGSALGGLAAAAAGFMVGRIL